MIALSGAGWAFVALDAAWPAPHIAAVIEDCRPIVLLHSNVSVAEQASNAHLTLIVVVRILLRKAVKTQVKHIRIPAGQYNAREIPINVATPFPPLNLSHIGKQCPKKELKAAI